MYDAKKKSTDQLFACAESGFSHNAAHIFTSDTTGVDKSVI